MMREGCGGVEIQYDKSSLSRLFVLLMEFRRVIVSD